MANAKVKPKALSKTKKKLTVKVTPAANTEVSKKQLVNKLFSFQEIDVPDLNTSTGYPVHPNRIWPD